MDDSLCLFIAKIAKPEKETTRLCTECPSTTPAQPMWTSGDQLGRRVRRELKGNDLIWTQANLACNRTPIQILEGQIEVDELLPGRHHNRQKYEITRLFKSN
jgi:hypothetical protein